MSTLTNVKIVCIDFDGVLHSYTSGWQGESTIPDDPIPGALAWLLDLVRDPRFDPQIYSSRSKSFAARHAMRKWLTLHYVAMLDYPGDSEGVSGFAVDLFSSPEIRKLDLAKAIVGNIGFPTSKPPAFLSIDDRAVQFTGQFPTMQTIAEFAPWRYTCE